MAFPFGEMTFSFQKCAHKMKMSENGPRFNCFHTDFTKYVIIIARPKMEIGKNGSLFTFFFTKT